ncbi:iron ABC transporter permease [Evansella sp. LMS18]|uniref:FecCD family ABC transporter permease n=1 Tax=Evansella sp. LMS18 TaxID=2924033 RepID=UPI0020D15EAD|nr:iron ABC transporter permease [Evansella sp. LMS18]UTR11070.1 iron ABC transporter permease [Evansella sp. LMS18]
MKKLFFRLPKIAIFFIFLFIFLVSFILSISVGKTAIPMYTIIEAFFNYDETVTEHIIITTSRISRTVIATVIGASLAVSGALMQALTRNPLAAPDIFGINAGALFFIVFSSVFLSIASLVHYMWIGFLGAGIAAVLVYFLGSLGRDGLAPVRIVLAGAAITALFVSFTQGILVLSEQNLQSVLFWLAGSVAGRSIEMLLPILPFMAAGLIGALLLGRAVNIMMSGEDVAKSLGQRTVLTKVVIGIIIVFLAGGSVAIGGAIGFIGLIVPHIVRGIIGIDYRWVIPFSAVSGATILLLADVAARLVIMPQEMPIGVMTALVGTPFFIYIARKGLSKNG